jgi:predicted lipoprotein with Yx(FWY)xxD motif
VRALVLAAALLVALACAGDAISNASAGGAGGRGTLTVRPSRFGRVLFDGRGFVLYAFTADRRNRATCYGACAVAWPPLLVERPPIAGSGTSRRLTGVTRRRDGRLQATYAGKPLYYYVGDRRPGQILCQNVSEFGGDWLVLSPGGGYVR